MYLIARFIVRSASHISDRAESVHFKESGWRINQLQFGYRPVASMVLLLTEGVQLSQGYAGSCAQHGSRKGEDPSVSRSRGFFPAIMRIMDDRLLRS
jgi:hypothetical protein